MKKTITILAILIVTLGNLSAQYQVAYKQAKAQERKGLYYKAILSYNAAAVSRDKPANNDLEKRINFCASKLNGLRVEANNAKNKAEKLASGVLELLSRSLPQGETDVFSYYLKLADTAYIKGQYNDAIGLYKNTILVNQINEKEKVLQSQISKSQNCIKLHTKAGKFMLELQLQKALIVYNEILKVNPKDIRAEWRIEAINRPSALKLLQSFKFVSVKGGTFMMGNSDENIEHSDNTRPVHKVILSDFKMGIFEVSNQQYVTFLNEYGSDYVKEGKHKGQNLGQHDEYNIIIKEGDKWVVDKGYENHPVHTVTWFGANEFCKYYGLELPTEAQWEYAAKGGIKNANEKKQNRYAGSNDINSVAWNQSNIEGGDGFEVGLKKPNELGLFDMSGNVAEWCSDWFSPTYYNVSPEIDPKGPQNGISKTSRGGSYGLMNDFCAITLRYSFKPDYDWDLVGFRFVLCP